MGWEKRGFNFQVWLSGAAHISGFAQVEPGPQQLQIFRSDIEMNEDKKRFLIVSVLVLIVAISGGLYQGYMGSVSEIDQSDPSKPEKKITIEKDIGNSIGLYLHLTHKRDGEVISETWKENDLILSNYANFTLMQLTCLDNVISVKDESGNSDKYERFSYATSNSKIAIGNGTTSPTFTDYKLESETHRNTISDWALTTSGTSYNITATTSFTFSASYSITEAGWVAGISHVSDDVFMTRDTFTAQEMNDGDTLSVSIIMEFTGGITDNYGEYIIDVLHGDDESEHPEDLDGNERSADYYYWGASAKMRIGSSSTAFALTDYSLGNQKYIDNFDSSDQYIYDVSGNDCNLTVIGYFTIDDSYEGDIYEVGVSNPIRTSGGDPNLYHILLCREVLESPWNVSEGDTISVYEKWIIDQP